ncbi:MAG TPA: PLP-dependent cysteine synthase family protein [Dehalococcoidia bacterium]|nr:PLP-dependent cysteine synthase family protein [Dehalococcoidia bacterium]
MKNSRNILDAIGHTPLIEFINMAGSTKVRIFGKFEGSNPGGSVKDRPALYMIVKAEQSGQLNKSKTIVEPTSGNTGIALAMIGAAKGYKVKLFMPECVSSERRSILTALNAMVELTQTCYGTDGAIMKAHEYVNSHQEECFMPNQFDNEYNALAHYETTGPEIWDQTEGDVGYFVAGMGTSGTLMGVGRYLKEQNSQISIVGIEPVRNHNIQGLKNMSESIVPKIYKPAQLDDKMYVDDDEAFETTRMLATHEGLFLGMSSGGAVAGALRLAKKLNKGNIVVLLPDRGDRYLSTSLFMSVCAKCPP